MTSNTIANRADFQRHLNGCEQRLNALTKRIQKNSENSSSNNNIQAYFYQLNEIALELKSVSSSILDLEQSSYSINGQKRLTSLKSNLEKSRIKLNEIRRNAQVSFGYEYNETDLEESKDGNQEQLVKLIDRKANTEQFELDFYENHGRLVNNLEKDVVDLHQTFRDLNGIVEEQGRMIISIEDALSSTEETIVQASEAVVETIQAKKRTKRIKWIVILILFGVLLIILIIVYIIFKLASPFR